MQYIGGLEPKDEKNTLLPIDGINYVVTDKFRSKLLANVIDWGTFLEIYHDKINHENTFNQILKLLDIKDNNNLREVMLPLLKKLYHLPADAHLACMMKQFMVYEPLSVAVHDLFTTLKKHYEDIIWYFVKARNDYIEANKAKGSKNDPYHLQQKWYEINTQESLESSSVVLLFFNGKHGLHYKLSCKDKDCYPAKKACDKLKSVVKRFEYKGFCPKVPYKRLTALLSFPLNEFVSAIKTMDDTVIFPNYKEMETTMHEILKEKPMRPKIHNTFKRKTPPHDLVLKSSRGNNDAELELIKWYVDNILELRKSLIEDGKKYELYFVELAKQIHKVSEMIKTHLQKGTLYV